MSNQFPTQQNKLQATQRIVFVKSTSSTPLHAKEFYENLWGAHLLVTFFKVLANRHFLLKVHENLTTCQN